MTRSATHAAPTGPSRTIAVGALRALIMAVLEALGATASTAGTQADQLVEAELRAHPSHGLQRLPMLVRRIRNGVIDPSTTGEHTWRTRSVLAVDGQRGLGPPVAVAALDSIVERAGETGVAMAAISNANHLGMLAPYVERAAAAGVVALATTTSEPLVHAWGGRDAAVGTNPLAIGVPTSTDPVVLDMATGAISRGKVIDHANRNEPLPPGTVVDADGNPTIDPHAALDGAIAPFGGPKGYALSVGLQLLVGALTTSTLGRDVVGTLDATKVCNKGDVLLCFDPQVVSGRDRTGAVSAFVDELRSTQPVDPAEPVDVPGDRSRRVRAEHLSVGRLPVSGAVWEQIRAISSELGITIDDMTEEERTS
jgi:L-2-hydroxycarboxylate dehydrogenase (NAD+)